MCFNKDAWRAASQGVDHATLIWLNSTASTLADVQADLFEAGPVRKHEILLRARPNLFSLRAALECASAESRQPENLPPKNMSEEEILKWAAGFTWNPES